MKGLYFFVAIAIFLFQISPGYTQPPIYEDTIQCRSRGGGSYCHAGPCPPAFVASGTCHGGAMGCCVLRTG